tara:strand:- start:2361 stop:3032 length:672 start_codon:yes stop_codon:yes gene_type:complete
MGGNLDALLYARQHNLPLIINKIKTPEIFEEKRDVWFQTFYSLSLAGLNLVGDKAQSVRIKDDEISVSTKDARVIKFDYKKIIIFDDEGVNGLPIPEKENNEFVVLDWMITRSCQVHDIDYMSTEDNLVSEVYFYPTERIDGNHAKVKDLVSVSHLTFEQLEDYEYSDTYAKFKIMSMLKEKGIRGKHNGGGQYRALNLEVEKREIKRAKMHSYKNTKRMEFK